MKLSKSVAWNFCLVGLLLVLCIDQLDARRSSKRKFRRHNDVNIEIYHPKGVMIWYPKSPEMVMFGIEIYLNPQSSNLTCDICLNTTDVTYGKFILRDDDAIIRARDHLQYRVIKQKVNKETYHAKSNDFYVAESRIIARQIECSQDEQPNASESRVSELKQQISVLHNVLNDVYQHCNNVTRASKNLYLNIRPMETRLDSKGLYNYTLDVLKEIIPSLDWDSALLHAYYYDDGIAFEVKSFIDKLKVLQMTRGSTQLSIQDLDELEDSTTDRNEIDAYEY